MRTTFNRVVGVLLTSVFFLSAPAANAIVRPDRDVSPGEARWTVYISEDFGGDTGRQLVCSGALVAPKLVVTAAHCVDGPRGFDSWSIRIGYSSTTSTDGVTRRPAAIVHHGKYTRTLTQEIYDEDMNLIETIHGDVRPGENDFDSDIAIIVLNHPVRSVAPLPLPSSPNYRPATGWRAYGWGVTGDNEDVMPARLLTAAQDDHTTAAATASNDPFLHLYAAVTHIEGKTSGTCWGDSGGPLVDGRGVLIGLTSFANAETCSDPAPTMFTKVSSFLTWIRDAENLAKKAIKKQSGKASRGDDPPFPVLIFEPSTLTPLAVPQPKHPLS
jgi:trypsin